MKIAVFYNLAFGGAKRSVQEHVRGLKKLGHIVDVYTLDQEHDIFDPGSVADNEYRYAYSPFVMQVPFLRRVFWDIQTFTTLKRLHKNIALDIDKKKYDIALIHTDTLLQAPFILRFLKTKNVYFCLEPLRMVYEYSLRLSPSINVLNRIYESWNRYLRKEADRRNARSAHSSLSISLFGREYMIQAYDIYPKISYLGVNTSVFKHTETKKKKQILFVAEKEYIYGYDLAEAAMKLIPEEKRPELKIVFGTNKAKRISDEDLVSLYNESIATLSLSRFDTFGLVSLESMACGTPVIALNVAGYRETILHEKTGYLVEFDPKEIAQRIMFLLENKKKAEKMGVEGRKWVEKQWTWQRQITILEKHLKLLV